ncbi:hypothetical protein RUM44_005127 [Polyplax serrata]|uniref:BTB domain-containing protein n=1 Tax=Polyplax serrata TaxID=468196 RepID=A0ABR1AE57_POLSC
MKPRVIILGGCGFIGRNLVYYLITNDLVEHIRVVDKVPPQIAWLNSSHQLSFSDPRVQFKSCNLTNPDSCKNAFAPDESGCEFDYVVNCAGETKPGQTDPVYKEGILKLSSLCANAAAQHQIKHYVELSAGTVASSDKIALKEDCNKEPWTNISKWKAQVEEILPTIPGLNYTILRPAIVYGIGDRSGLTPRLVIGSIYKHLGECMKLLWTKDLKMNTVHVNDVCRAIWFVISREDTKFNIYNIVDDSNSTQGSISSLVSEIFNINHDYWGTAISSIAKADLTNAVEEVNEKHLAPWAEICSRDGVLNTPLSPYIDKELLANKNLFLNGSKLKDLGFTYSVPIVTAEQLKEVDNSCSVLVKIATLYAEKLMNDLCLVVGGKEYPCHRLILCASSEVFQVMLMNPQWSESSESRVVLVESKECCKIFGDFLKYFYTGQIRINLQSVMPVLLLADKYNVKDLVKLCVDYMCSHIAQAAENNSLISWLQYTHHCGHKTVAKASRNFVKWNLDVVAKTQDFGNFEPNVFVNLLQETDLVVYNEMRLYEYVVKWLNYQKEKFPEENDMEQLVVEVMSNIRFPMMSPRQLAELLLSPLTTKYKEFFVEKMAIGMSFHSGQTERIKEVLQEEDGHLLFTPRLYTADTHSTLLTVENYSLLPTYYTSTLVFSSYASLADHAGDKTCEWVVDVYPKGVWFKRFYLIVWQGTLEVPELVLRTVRLSITCKDPPPPPADIRVKIGIVIYGTQNDIEHIMFVYERNHHFSETERVLNLDDLLSFEQLNPFMKSGTPSEFLVGPNRDALKIHIVIEPLNDILTAPKSDKPRYCW